MHISEGVLAAQVLAGGAAITAIGTAVGLKKLDYDQLPKTALLSAGFFVASLIHVPVGPSSVHLLLTGLVGILLGWAAFPAILVAMALQAILFQFGGIIVLGVNTANAALAALICYYLFGALARNGNNTLAVIAAALAGGSAVLLNAFFAALSLYLGGEEFLQAAQALFMANLPIMALEAGLTAVIIGFMRQVRPAMLNGKAV